MHESLKNKVVVITGGSGVLCSTIAKELAKNEMRVVILNRNYNNGEKIVEEIRSSGGYAVNYAVDVLDKSSLSNIKNQIYKEFGQIDILINGAGGNSPQAITNKEIFESIDDENNFFDLTISGVNQVFNTNFLGTFIAIQTFGKELIKAKGSIINISSMSSYSPMTKVPAYSAAKASINNFTQWLAVHFAKVGLRVNAIAPGFFITEQNHYLLLDEQDQYTPRATKIIESTPQKRFGEPKDLLGAILFLADEQYSSFVTGITIPIDGGFMAYSGV